MGEATTLDTLIAEIIARLKPADWYLISEALNERATEVEKGNWITGTPGEDAEVLGHNDPETLRGIAFIARVIAEWTDTDEVVWAGPPDNEAVPDDVCAKILEQIDSWRSVEEAKQCPSGLLVLA